MMTQSVGVPRRAKCLSQILRSRSGSFRVSEWASPLWSVSGATTQTSSDSVAGDALQSRQALGVDAVVIGQQDAHQAQSAFSIGVDAAHIGQQHVGNGDGAVLVLIVFHDRDQRAADGDARTVERVDEARALARPWRGSAHSCGGAWKSPQTEQDEISR